MVDMVTINWYAETETPEPWDESGRCIHPGLFSQGGPLDQTQQCGHCGQDVPDYML